MLQLFPLRPQLVLLELRPEAVRSRRGAVALGCVVMEVVVGGVVGVGRRRDARAVRRARGQRLAVAQDVFDEEGRGGGARGGSARQRVVLLLLTEVEEVVLVVEAVVMGMQRMLGTVRGVHGNRDGGRGLRAHGVYVRARGGRRGVAPRVRRRRPGLAEARVCAHHGGRGDRTRVRGAREDSVYSKAGAVHVTTAGNTSS